MTPRVLTRQQVAEVPDLFPGSAAATVRLRSLERGDAAAVRAVFAGMGARSRELRFLTHKPRLTDGEVQALTGVDGRDHEAVLATSATDGAPVGIARFVRTDDAAAEVAVAVVDAWQRRGVGTVLLAALARRAGELGVRRLHADVASENTAALQLLRRSRARWSLVHVGHGVSQVVVALDAVAA
jgi:RimJ/RimL family protein N-acetyltransferase